MRSLFLCVIFVFGFGKSVAQFIDITQEVGIDHAHVQSQLFGGGIAAFDFDNDGFEDLFLTGGEGQDKLLLNNRSGGYIDISEVLPHNQFKSEVTSGVVHADFDQDGCIDLFITSFNREENGILLQNTCDGGFKEVTNRAGIIENSASIGATLIDYDQDGDLDIYVINYIWQSRLLTNDDGETIGFDHTCAPNHLYENEGNMRFREVASQLGAQGSGCALAATTVHFINNSPAIYIANDFGEWIQPNELLMYDHVSGKFADVAPQYGLDYGLYGMGIAIADVDRDDDLDIYVSNLGQNAFLENDGSNFFSENAVSRGIDNTNTPDSSLAVSWGLLFSDFNNDLWPDLFVSNGWIPSAEFIATSFEDPCKYYRNEQGRFIEESEDLGINFSYINRGVVNTYIDQDGLPDIILSGLDDTDFPEGPRKYRMLKNDYSRDNQFLKIELQGQVNNLEGYGAMVEVYHNNEKEIQISYPGATFSSHGTKILHFGLDTVSVVDSIKVLWPNGMKDVIQSIPLNQLLLITEGGGMDIKGCTDDSDPYYNPLATVDSGCQFSNSTSVSDLSIKHNIDVYPTIINSGRLNILSDYFLEDVLIEILNTSGMILFQKHIHLYENTSNQITIPDQMLSGTYFINLRKEGRSISSHKFVVQK